MSYWTDYSGFIYQGEAKDIGSWERICQIAEGMEYDALVEDDCICLNTVEKSDCPINFCHAIAPFLNPDVEIIVDAKGEVMEDKRHRQSLCLFGVSSSVAGRYTNRMQN